MLIHSLLIWLNELQMLFDKNRSTNKLTISIHVLYMFVRMNFYLYVISMIRDESLIYYQIPMDFKFWPTKVTYVIQKILDRQLYSLQSFEWLMYSNYILHMSKTKV